MSTRGYLVFKWRGMYYVIYNHSDSYPSRMGYQILVQIIEWMNRYQGKTQDVQEFLSRLFDNLTLIEKFQSTGHPFDRFAYEDIETKLKTTTHPISLCNDISPKLQRNLMIDYIWTIDVDDKKFQMELPYEGIEVSFTWQHLWKKGIEFWREATDRSNDEWESLRGYYLILSMTKFQSVVRGFLERRRGLIPPDGALFLLAKKRFERGLV
jgi:hypothetical protein